GCAIGVTEPVEKLRVPRGDGGVYRLTLEVPGPEVKKGSPWVVTALLPPGATYAGDAPDVFRPAANDETRPALTWNGTQDPPLDVIWKYVRMKVRRWRRPAQAPSPRRRSTPGPAPRPVRSVG